MLLRPVLRGAAGGLALGGFLYLVGDTASDLLTYRALHGAALELVAADEQLVGLVGAPYTTGAWYNATLGFSHRDRVAHCTFQLQGSRRVSDVAVKAGRASAGPASVILYNLAARPGGWRLLSCQAMVPAEGGLVQPRSLMPEHREDEQAQKGGGASGGGGLSPAAARAAAIAAGCQPGSSQQQQQGSQQQQGRSQRGWWRWPWRRGPGGDVGGGAGGGQS
jgi:hypothetical protein